MARVPFFSSNWTVRAGLRARRGIRRMDRAPAARRPLHAHPGAGCALRPTGCAGSRRSSRSTRRRASTTSSASTTSTAGSGRIVEAAKWRANRLCFDRAAHIVAWSAWTKQGLIDEYDVDADKITVIPPGVMRSLWARSEPRSEHAGPVRILFVGGAWQRKGGDLLL